ncbi:MAG: HNH endonuclease family protein [Bdellovibrio sp.]
MLIPGPLSGRMDEKGDQMDFILLVLLKLVWAQNLVPEARHFRIDDQKTWTEQQLPAEFLQASKWLQRAQSSSSPKWLSLLRWVPTPGPMEAPTEPYNRRLHFGSWIQIQAKDCRNTRAWVLARSSGKPVTYRAPRLCVVESGEWVEPYVGRMVSDASELQIDHLVPLQNAYVSGAWKWSARDRCQYANFLANPEHLVPVDVHQNMVKGDLGPEAYLPPRKEFVCDYIRRWLRVKMVWGLALSQGEAEGILQALKLYKCAPQALLLSESELVQMRSGIPQAPTACQKRSATSGPYLDQAL